MSTNTDRYRLKKETHTHIYIYIFFLVEHFNEELMFQWSRIEFLADAACSLEYTNSSSRMSPNHGRPNICLAHLRDTLVLSAPHGAAKTTISGRCSGTK